MTQPEMNTVERFLRESNAIEGVYDNDSLIQSLRAWSFLMEQDEMTPAVVRQTHALLMRNQNDIPDSEKGAFRPFEVSVGRHIALNHVLVPEAIEEWCAKMNKKSKIHPWKELHVEYEKIHPFSDGNGRTGRMFMNWGRLRNRLVLMTIFEEKKYAYYAWFNERSSFPPRVYDL